MSYDDCILFQVRDLSIELMAQNGFIKEFHARSCLNLTDKGVIAD